jgi:hypothetical protein
LAPAASRAIHDAGDPPTTHRHKRLFALGLALAVAGWLAWTLLLVDADVAPVVEDTPPAAAPQ